MKQKLYISAVILALLFFLFGPVLAFGQKVSDMTRISTLASNDLVSVSQWTGAAYQTRSVAYSNLVQAVRTDAVPITSAVYFASRTDARDGTGSELDPYNASTPSRLHARWNTIFGTRQDNKVFIFKPGVYWTTNTMRLTLGGTNIHFIGYGARINCTNANQAYSGSLFGNVTTRITNASWSGFDVDLGSGMTFSTPPNRVWNGMSCDGQDITLRDLTFRNVASTGLDVESFGIIAGITNGSVLNCRVSGMAGPYTSAIAIVGSQIACVGNVIDLGDPGDLVSPWAFGLTVYASDSVVAANIVRNADTGLHMDNTSAPGPWKNVSVTGNYFNAAYPVRIEPSATYFSDWIFSGNTFSTTNRWINSPEVGGGGVISNMTYTANGFTGTALDASTLNFNSCETITFNANYFSKQPVFASGSPSVYGVGNVVNGSPNDLAFITPGLTPFGALELWGGSQPVDTTTGNRVTNYARAYSVGGFTVATNTGTITVPKTGYYRVAVTHEIVTGGAGFAGTVYTNGVTTGIAARGYSDGTRNASAAGLLYMVSGTVVDLRSSTSANSKDASLWVESVK